MRQLIAENIAYYRKLNGDTQAGLAEKLSYSDKSVSKWERGDGTPDIFILSHIASLYGITVQDLLREKKVAKTRTRHLLISLLSVGLVWLVMTVLFCGAQIFSICDRYAWLLFIYGIPISGIVAQVFCALWSNQLSQIFACSLIIWGRRSEPAPHGAREPAVSCLRHLRRARGPSDPAVHPARADALAGMARKAQENAEIVRRFRSLSAENSIFSPFCRYCQFFFL